MLSVSPKREIFRFSTAQLAGLRGVYATVCTVFDDAGFSVQKSEVEKVTYLKKLTLSQQQQKLKELIDKRLRSEESGIKQRAYQWLNDNQYFVDNELFDFYFCVAQYRCG